MPVTTLAGRQSVAVAEGCPTGLWVDMVAGFPVARARQTHRDTIVGATILPESTARTTPWSVSRRMSVALT